MRTQCVDTECHIFDVNPTVFALAADLKSLNGEHTLRSLATDVCKAQSVIGGGGGGGVRGHLTWHYACRI